MLHPLSQGIFLPPYNQLQFLLLQLVSTLDKPGLVSCIAALQAPEGTSAQPCSHLSLLQPFLHALTLGIG